MLTLSPKGPSSSPLLTSWVRERNETRAQLLRPGLSWRYPTSPTQPLPLTLGGEERPPEPIEDLHREPRAHAQGGRRWVQPGGGCKIATSRGQHEAAAGAGGQAGTGRKAPGGGEKPSLPLKLAKNRDVALVRTPGVRPPVPDPGTGTE